MIPHCTVFTTRCMLSLVHVFLHIRFSLLNQHLAQWRPRWSVRALHRRQTDLGRLSVHCQQHNYTSTKLYRTTAVLATHLLSAHLGSPVAASPADDEASCDVPGEQAGGLWSPRASEDQRSQHPLHRRLVHTLLSAGVHRGWSETSCLVSNHHQRH